MSTLPETFSFKTKFATVISPIFEPSFVQTAGRMPNPMLFAPGLKPSSSKTISRHVSSPLRVKLLLQPDIHRPSAENERTDSIASSGLGSLNRKEQTNPPSGIGNVSEKLDVREAVGESSMTWMAYLPGSGVSFR